MSFASLALFFGVLLGSDTCSGIVSLAPSLSEMIYELELGDRLVGRSRYDAYPPQVKKLPQVGSFTEVNYEALVRLAPTELFLLEEQSTVQKQIESLGIHVYVFDHRTLEGIDTSIKEISKICQKEAKADALLQKMRTRESKILTLSNKAPEVLIVIGKFESEGSLSGIFLSGRDGYFHQLLRRIGAQPAFSGITSSVGSISMEGMRSLNPEVIIHILPPEDKLPSQNELLSSWSKLGDFSAVKDKRVYAANDDFLVIPGPRYVLAEERLSGLIYGTSAP